jgi:hypothetical protein
MHPLPFGEQGKALFDNETVAEDLLKILPAR